MKDLILTYEQALIAIDEGIWDWDELTRNLPRNTLPAVLEELEASSLMFFDDGYSAELAHALTVAWVMAEFPEQYVSRKTWIRWFRQVGYIVNGDAADPPEQVTLFRGGVHFDRMAWTSGRFVAEWFRDRWPNGKLWAATVPADRLLAHVNNLRLEESGRSEDEYIIDPTGLRPKEIR